MPVIVTHMVIQAPLERVFDLARSIDLHQASTAKTSERAIEGVTTGLIELGQSVTWRARHFGFWHVLGSQITEFDRPQHFQDCMTRGAFKYFKHDHDFAETAQGTRMSDRFDFASPFGVLGSLVDVCIMRGYLTRFIVERNQVIKRVAESDEWQTYLPK